MYGVSNRGRTHIYSSSVTGGGGVHGDDHPHDSLYAMNSPSSQRIRDFTEDLETFFAVAEELLAGLKAQHASAAEALLERLGDMCATAAEALAEDGGDNEVAGLGRAAGKALGAAINSMGPAAVLRILPLTLEASAPSALCTSCKTERHQSS